MYVYRTENRYQYRSIEPLHQIHRDAAVCSGDVVMSDGVERQVSRRIVLVSISLPT